LLLVHRGGQNKADRLRISQRRARVAELALQGCSQIEIAARLGKEECPSGNVTVCQDLKAIEKQWKQTTLQDFNAIKAKGFAELELLKKKLWEDYERSRQTKTGAPRVGSARIALAIQRCIMDQQELMGVVAKSGEPSTAPPVIAFKFVMPDGTEIDNPMLKWPEPAASPQLTDSTLAEESEDHRAG
jgi:hypothetical protein